MVCPHCQHVNEPLARHCTSCQRSLVVAERFLLGAVLAENDGITVQVGTDTWRCANCRQLTFGQGTDCPRCSSPLREGLRCYLRKQTQPPRSLPTAPYIETWLFEPAQQVWYGIACPIDLFPKGLALIFGSLSDAGASSRNEDALMIHSFTGAFAGRSFQWNWCAVADGMGGHATGDLASERALARLHTELQKFFDREIQPSQNVTPHADQPWELIHALAQPIVADYTARYRSILESAVRAANLEIGALAQQRASDLGTTLTAALFIHAQVLIANVGDSRAYLYRNGELRQITTDHSKVYALAQQNIISREEIYTHPERNLITRALDGSPQLVVDVFELALKPHDRLVLCSDGLWETVRDRELAQILASSDPQRACTAAVAQANAAGGEDNISILVTAVHAAN